LKHRSIASFAFIVLTLAAFSVPFVLFASTAKAAVLYYSGNPTPEEQLVLEYINRARADPIGEGQRLGIDIHEGLSDPGSVGPRPPLAMNSILLGVAEAHSRDMYNLNYFSHNDPNGTTPYGRMVHAGYEYVLAGENMAAGVDLSAVELEDLMMVDSGTPGRPHRVNLLDLINPYPCGNPPCAYSEVGIGYYESASPNGMGLTSLITEDFGAAANAGPFLLGVVYNDRNGNNFYDTGEGLAGVTITPSSSGYYAVSSSSGGYVIPVGTSGTITVTASGPGFAPITKTVTLNGANVKLDFTISAQTNSSTSTSTHTGTTSTVTTTTSTAVTQVSSQTTSVINRPSIALNHVSASPGSIVDVYGSGFSSDDTACSLSGSAVLTWTCLISTGTLTASFVVANAMVGSHSVAATGNPAGDSASAILTVSASANQTTTSTSTNTTGISTSTSTALTSSSTSITLTKDFSVTSSVSTIALAQGGSGSATITVFSINGFSSPVTLSTSWVENTPTGIGVSITSPVTPFSGGAATSLLIVSASSSASPGTFAVQLAATSGSLTHILTSSIVVQTSQAVYSTSTSKTTIMSTATNATTSPHTLPPLQTNCAFSSATAGSQLAPLAQALRTFRDQSIMKTRSGVAFMILFNAWYYSFSPRLASNLASQPAQRTLLRYGLYPLLGILHLSYYAYLLIYPLNNEIAALTSGIVVASLIGLVYLAPTLYLATRILRRKLTSYLNPIPLAVWSAISLLGVLITYSTGARLPLGIAEASLMISNLTLGGLSGTLALTHLNPSSPNMRVAIMTRLTQPLSHVARRPFEDSRQQTS
jgi:hypothetical protein